MVQDKIRLYVNKVIYEIIKGVDDANINAKDKDTHIMYPTYIDFDIEVDGNRLRFTVSLVQGKYNG